MNANHPIRILLVDDHRVVRAGLRAILEDHPEFAVVAEAADGAQALAHAADFRPDMALLDMRLPDAPGPEVCRRLKRLDPAIKVVALTSFAEDTLVFNALAAGVDGYLLKDCHDEELARSLATIARGMQVLAPSVMAIVAGSRQRPPAPGPFDSFTPRELSVLRLLAEGCVYKEIGSRLNLAEKTVRNTVCQLVEKSGMTSRNELIAQFVRSDLGRV